MSLREIEMIASMILSHKKRLHEVNKDVEKYEFEISALEEMLDEAKKRLAEMTPQIEE